MDGGRLWFLSGSFKARPSAGDLITAVTGATEAELEHGATAARSQRLRAGGGRRRKS
ncbi:uncharacterized protein V6R79_001039 [Siganus canaliculatus]